MFQTLLINPVIKSDFDFGLQLMVHQHENYSGVIDLKKNFQLNFILLLRAVILHLMGNIITVVQSTLILIFR